MSSDAKHKTDHALAVGSRIGRALSLLGVSQSEFARQCGLSRASISLIINRGQAASLEVMRVLGEDHGISLQWLLLGGPNVFATAEQISPSDPLLAQIRLATAGPNGNQRRARLEGYLASLVAQAADDAREQAEQEHAEEAQRDTHPPGRRTA
jgi:transcriptional regulator with XRE-family HTH domain